MRTSLLFISAAVCGACTSHHREQPEELQMLVGTYTVDSESKGIYLLQMNQQTGTVAWKDTVGVGNPSFLTPPTGQGVCYAVSEFPDGRAAANVIGLDGDTLALRSTTLCSPREEGAEDPCNIWTDGDFVVTANYTGGSLSVFAVHEEGQRLALRQFIEFLPLEEGAVSHIHCALPTPDGKFLLVTDLGNDCMYRYTINRKAAPDNDLPFLTDRRIVYNGPKGWGPRHFTFREDGRFLYLINELGGTLVVMRYMNGALLPVQHELAEEEEAHGSADIHLSPDGAFLYASHRLKHDGISIYKINQKDGHIEKVGYQTTARHPRNFAITPNGRYLLVACRDDNCIEIYRRDLRNGLLEKMEETLAVPKPVCIQLFTNGSNSEKSLIR